MKLTVGSIAPDFSLLDQDGKLHALSDFRGKKVVLYFYPKDDTPGCTAEACSLRDAFAELKELTVVLGVSADSVESHRKFAKKYGLPFPLLADPKKEAISAYGADGVLAPKRITFLIDEAGVIQHFWEKVKVDEHAQEILPLLRV